MTVLRYDVERAEETEDESKTGPVHPSGVSLCLVEGQLVFSRNRFEIEMPIEPPELPVSSTWCDLSDHSDYGD
jgi:hypothetical protein